MVLFIALAVVWFAGFLLLAGKLDLSAFSREVAGYPVSMVIFAGVAAVAFLAAGIL